MFTLILLAILATLAIGVRWALAVDDDPAPMSGAVYVPAVPRSRYLMPLRETVRVNAADLPAYRRAVHKAGGTITSSAPTHGMAGSYTVHVSYPATVGPNPF